VLGRKPFQFEKFVEDANFWKGWAMKHGPRGNPFIIDKVIGNEGNQLLRIQAVQFPASDFFPPFPQCGMGKAWVIMLFFAARE
jgi:hypothetical protein